MFHMLIHFKTIVKHIMLLDIVNQWLLASIQHQLESPVWGVVKKKTLFSTNSSIMIQHGCKNRIPAR